MVIKAIILFLFISLLLILKSIYNLSRKYNKKTPLVDQLESKKKFLNLIPLMSNLIIIAGLVGSIDYLLEAISRVAELSSMKKEDLLTTGLYDAFYLIGISLGSALVLTVSFFVFLALFNSQYEEERKRLLS